MREKVDPKKLQSARELLARPDGWIQHGFAEDSMGRSVHWKNCKAVCFCGEGAIWRVGGSLSEIRAVGSVVDTRYGLASWNDRPGRTQTEVVAAFDRAIELAKASPLGSAPGDDAAKDI